MWKPLVILVLCVWSLANAVPLGLKKNMAIMQEQEEPMLVMAEDEETRPEMMISRLNLPSNATSIRADITDGFSCDNKTYGYYADVENECQIFHVCLPVTYADGKENTFRWSFICPEETVFSQEYFTCMRSEDMSIDCEESFKYYELNRNFGMIEPESVPSSDAEEEMPMEDMSRQPSSEVQEESNMTPFVEAAPVKKQTIKVQSSNRRKTQTNRVTTDTQRKKVHPLRKLPTPPVVTTAKPVVEEAPILEQEVERTTIKYQRFTKRPIGIIPEQPKPEASKPEQEIVRQDLFAQKRKRPQIFFPTRFDAAVQTDTESKPPPSLRTDIVLQKKPEPVPQDQAEAQASEITEVSIKPVDFKSVQSEKTKPMLKNNEPAVVFIPLKENEPQPERIPLPENTQSRVEVVEIPIQKLDEPLKVEEPIVPVVPAVPAVISELSQPEAPKPIEKVMSPVKAVEEKPTKEETLSGESILDGLKKIIAASDKTNEKPKESEKIPLETVPEPETIHLDEPEQILQIVKLAELPKTSESHEPEKENTVEPVVELKVAEEAVIPEEVASVKPVEALVDPKPEMLLKSDTPLEETPSMIELPEAKPDLEKPEETLRSEEVVPVIVESGSTAVESEPMKEESPAPQPIVPAAQPEQILKTENTEPEVLLKTETPAAEVTMPLEAEFQVPVPVKEVTLMNENSEKQKLEAPVSEMAEQLKLDIAVPATEQKPNEQLQSELPSANQEVSKTDEMMVQPELPSANQEVSKTDEMMPHADLTSTLKHSESDELDLKAKPLEPVEKESAAEPTKEKEVLKIESPQLLETDSPQEPAKDLVPLKAESSEVLEEKSSEVQAEEIASQASQQSNEKSNPATDNEEAQSLILDFISSLVNSENSNFEEQSAITNEMIADSLPEASVAETTIAEEKLQAQEEQLHPMYIPMMPNNDQMYQIPVQVIETPEPEPMVVEPVVPEPKLPLTVDEVVELVKESLDTPAEKENLVQEPSSDDSSAHPESEEVKPIYHRYIELGSNLLKSEALTASEDEPVVISSDKVETPVEDISSAAELLKSSDNPSEPEQLALKSEIAADSLPEIQAIPAEVVQSEKESAPQAVEGLKEGRSLNRFKMDPRKRRFLFRSDAS